MGKRKKKSGKSLRNTTQVKIHLNRKHKDSVFCMLFNDKEKLLSLFNAINDSNYTDPDELEITTIGDAIYIGHRKNDVSFLIDNYMNLYEAQSTRNPNMPLRGLGYFSQVYGGYAEQRGLNIYSDKLLELPTPCYVVLYNGTAYEPERQEYRLSDSFVHSQKECCLECVATVLNINAGHNKELMEKCRTLYEYAEFVAIMRRYLETARCQESMDEAEAVDKAIEECIREGILVEFLSKHRGEVCRMILTVYNEERHYRNEKQASYESGRAEGEAIGRAVGKSLGKAEGKAEALLVVLEILGDVSLELREKILVEKDIAVLDLWMKEAVRAESIGAFTESVQLEPAKL